MKAASQNSRKFPHLVGGVSDNRRRPAFSGGEGAGLPGEDSPAGERETVSCLAAYPASGGESIPSGWVKGNRAVAAQNHFAAGARLTEEDWEKLQGNDQGEKTCIHGCRAR